MASDGAARFGGFGQRALDFLKALGFHQSKAWFDENRAIYETELRRPLELLVADLTAAFAASGLPLRGDARSIFRLHRDTRFSKDKRPYKTNAGAVLSRDGTKRSQGFVYVHLDPEGSFAAAGFWHPEPDERLRLRRAVLDRADAFRTMLTELAKAGLELGDGDPVTRLPKGFEAVGEGDLASAIRKRNLIVRRAIAPEALRDPGLVAWLAAFGREAEPLLRFGWEALGVRE